MQTRRREKVEREWEKDRERKGEELERESVITTEARGCGNALEIGSIVITGVSYSRLDFFSLFYYILF